MPRKESADKPQADILTVPLLQTQMTPLYDLTGMSKLVVIYAPRPQADDRGVSSLQDV